MTGPIGARLVRRSFEDAYGAINDGIPVRRAGWAEGLTLRTLYDAAEREGEPVNVMTPLALFDYGVFPTVYSITAEDRAATDWEIMQ